MFRVLSIILLFFSINAFGRDGYSGIPYIKNFHKSEYRAGTQNWAISQDQNGFIYFANNDGLLSFNGVEWNLTRVSSSSPLRSLLVDNNNNIYVGLINDFGIISRRDNKPSSFKSLKDLLPERYKEFDDIWRIHEAGEGIVFQCYKYMFIYTGDTIKVVQPGTRFHFSYKIRDKLLVHEPGAGIYELIGGKLIKLGWWQEHRDKEISTILEADNGKMLVCTTYDGVFILENGFVRRWETQVNESLLKNRLFSAAIMPDNKYAFGTILNGLIVSDNEGNILHSLNTHWGIQNNTVLSLFIDKSENLWLGLDNGIDYLETDSPVSFIGSKKIGTGYCCRVFEGNLYLGTNQGLYLRPFNGNETTGEFTLVENTAGQVWTLEEFGGKLLCGHNQGTYLVKGRTAKKIGNEPGAWKFIPLTGIPDMFIGGHYGGLALYRTRGDQVEFYKKIEGFEESSRYIYQDSRGYIWVGHSGKGIFRIRLNEGMDGVSEVVSFTDDRGLLSRANNILFSFDGRIYVSTDQGIFEFEDADDTFVPSEKLNEIYKNSGKIKSVAEAGNGYTWYIGESESGYIRENEDMTYTRITLPLRKLRDRFVNEFEFIYPFNDENVFIGIEDGFANYNPGVTNYFNKEFRAFITRVELSYIDSVLYLLTTGNNRKYEFPWKRNSLRFYFASPLFENESPMLFSYYLKGFSDEWSDWSEDHYKDFTNLREGEYTLSLKSKNIYDMESENTSFQFEILPPWRRSKLAYILYLFIFSMFIFFVIRYIIYRVRLAALMQEEKYQKELEEQKYRHQQETLIAEKEIIDLRNEKLHAEVVFRDKELANQTMAIIEKNKFLKRINEELYSIQDFVVNDLARAKLTGLKKRISKEIDIKHQNKIFEAYFDEANEEFFKRLKEKYPDLTSYDLRLCAFIRMNMPTKEIAAILNITYRGAEVSRYRLRKKMQLPREINLSSWLAGF